MKIRAAVSDDTGGLDVEFDTVTLTVAKAEAQLPRLTTLRAYCSMAVDSCRELLAVAAPERARIKYQSARNEQKE